MREIRRILILLIIGYLGSSIEAVSSISEGGSHRHHKVAVYFPINPEDFQDFGIKLSAVPVAKVGKSLPPPTTQKPTTTTNQLPIAQQPHAQREPITEPPGPSYLTDSYYYVKDTSSTTENIYYVRDFLFDLREDEDNRNSLTYGNDDDIIGFSSSEDRIFKPSLEDLFVPMVKDLPTPPAPIYEATTVEQPVVTPSLDSDTSDEVGVRYSAPAKTTKLTTISRPTNRYRAPTSPAPFYDPVSSKQVDLKPFKQTTVFVDVKPTEPTPPTNYEFKKSPGSEGRIVLRPAYNPIPFESSKVGSSKSTRPNRTGYNSPKINNFRTTTTPKPEGYRKPTYAKSFPKGPDSSDTRFPSPSAHSKVVLPPAVTVSPREDTPIYRTSTNAYRPPSSLYRTSNSKEVTSSNQLEFKLSDDNIYVPHEYDEEAVPGEAGIDYPIYDTVPETTFDCNSQEHPGLYADTEAKCQVFHICQQETGRQDSFLCPNGTVFNQQYFVCDWWYNFSCDHATRFYSLNALLNELPDTDKYQSK